jgi:lycopene cyclase domain-containing protein
MMGRDILVGALVSYGHFLLVFLVLPILGLAFVLRRSLTVRYVRTVLTMAAIAFVYTTPWDNAIVALGVWSYDPALVWGIVLGWVPLEEYLFFLLQPMLSGLILLALLARSGQGGRAT